jgi:hypothetical protein
MNILHSGRGEVKAEAEAKKIQKISIKLLTSKTKRVIIKTVKGKQKGGNNMKNLEIGMKVRAYTGSCIGLLIQSTEWQGEIIKVNKKSIRVRLTESTSKFGSKTTSHRENLNTEKTFRFVKTLSNGKDWYKSEGGLYGSIDV